MTTTRVLTGLILTFGTVPPAAADFVPLRDGFVEYVEIVDYGWFSLTDSQTFSRTGTDPLLPETVSAAVTGASGSARTLAGGGSSTARAETHSESYVVVDPLTGGTTYSSYVQGGASVAYDVQLLKLHPDAPDIDLPLSFTSTLYGIRSRLAIENLSTATQLVQEDGDWTTVRLVNSTIQAHLGDTLRVEAYATQLGGQAVTGSGWASAPEFELDSGLMVPFGTNPDGTVRYERAVDLYTLAYPQAIGYSGDFNAVTPLTDGCLPDPSIIGPSGTQSVTGGETVTCQALDPSGFRSYGPGVQDPLGRLSQMSLVITPGSIVRTDADDTETIGLLGSDNDIFNEGTILSTGARSDAVFLAEGNGNSVENHGAIGSTGLQSHAVYLLGDGVEVYSTGAISSSGDDAAAVYLEGDLASLLNEGVITADGIGSSGVVIEGDDALLLNAGDVQTTADLAAALVVEGDSGELDNSGSIATQGLFGAGLVMLGFYSEAVENSGSITTLGDDAMGVLALGAGHRVDNLGSTAGGGRIWTLGERAHGIALGLQQAVLPPGVAIPPEALDPVVDGVIDNSGHITTEGDHADAIHALAAGLPVTNTGFLETEGPDAHGVSVVGAGTGIDNRGDITTAGIGSHGIYIRGRDAVIGQGSGLEGASIQTTGRGSKGVFVAGDGAQVTLGDGGGDPVVILTSGENADGILIDGDDARVFSEGSIAVTGDLAYGIAGFGDGGTFENDGAIAAGAGPLSNGNRGMDVNGVGSTVRNTGDILVDSADGVGLAMLGEGAVATNGDLAHTGARIQVSGAGTRGIDVTTDAAAVVNEGSIQVAGQGARGISATAGLGAVSQVTSAGEIDVEGADAVGMLLQTSTLWGAGTARNLAPACNMINDGSSKLINCGGIDFPNSPNGAGMLALDVADTTVENQSRIRGDGVGARGISVHAGLPPGTPADVLVANVDRIAVDGDGAMGIELVGSGNVVLQGNGTIGIPSEPFAYVTDLQSADGYSLYPNAEQLANEFTRDVPSGTLIPVARITVNGPDAVGVAVSGDGNRIGQLFSGQTDQTRIEARGTGAVGVRLAGNGNLFVNGGEVIGDHLGIQGGAGDDSVTNQWLVEGGIDLAGGNDRLLLDTASQILGTADGGDGQDELIFFVGGGQSGPFQTVIDGDQYLNFEQAAKIGAGRLNVLNSLAVDVLTIHKGTVATASGSQLITGSNSLHIMEEGELTGAGTAVGRVVVEGGVLAPGIGIGTLAVDGDLVLERGILEFEADGLFDLDGLDVSGDVTLDGGYVDVILGFTPDPDDELALFDVQGAFDVTGNFLGVRGIAAAGSGIALGTPFTVDLGGIPFESTVVSAVPVPPAALLLGSGLVGLLGAGTRRRRRSRAAAA